MRSLAVYPYLKGDLMYFDAVLDKDARPIFNGTSEETQAWLVENPSWDKRWVCIGETMKIITETEYLARK